MHIDSCGSEHGTSLEGGIGAVLDTSIPQPAFVVRVIAIIDISGCCGQQVLYPITCSDHMHRSYSGVLIQSAEFVGEVHDWYHGLRLVWCLQCRSYHYPVFCISPLVGTGLGEGNIPLQPTRNMCWFARHNHFGPGRQLYTSGYL